MLARRTGAVGTVAAVVLTLALAAAPAQAAVHRHQAPLAQERVQLGPVAAAVVAVGVRIGVRYGPRLVKIIKGGSRAAKRGRSAARRITRWGRRYAHRGRRVAIAAWAAFRRLPKWVQGCGLSAVRARLQGASLVGMAVSCIRGILLVAAGKDPSTDPGAFMSKKLEGPAYA